MAQVRKLNLTTELQLEWQGAKAISAWLLTHLDHNLRSFRLRIDELAPDGEVTVTFWQLINGSVRRVGLRIQS